MWPYFLFWISLALLIFTYLGYPVFLTLLAPFRKTPVIRPEPFLPGVSLIIAARNETRHIEEKLRNSLQLDYPPEQLEIIVVDDGSEDDTFEKIEGIIRRLGRTSSDAAPRLLVLRQSGRQGKAAALNRAVSESRGEILVFSDADSLIAPESLKHLVHPFINPIVGCVAGRYVPGGIAGCNAAGAGFYWRYEHYLRRQESRAGGLLGASGALYAVRREAFEPLPENLINDDFVMPMRITARGYRSLYEPRAIAIEDESENATLEFARRVRIMAGNWEHLWMFRGLIRDWRRWRTLAQLICHKLLRVLSPCWLGLILAANIFILFRIHPEHGVSLASRFPENPSARFYGIFLAAQVFCYLLAACGYLMRRRDSVNRLFSLPCYFCMINLSALCGAYYFLFNRRGLAWNAQTPKNSGDRNVKPAENAISFGE